MAEFRTIKTAMWREDDWFMDLETDARLFWIYLFSNPSASVAGIYRLSLRTMSHETGLSIDRVRELLGEFAQANKAHFADGVLWVVRMREHQETSSVKVQTRIKTDLASLPKSNSVYRMYCARYGIDTVSIPIPTDTVTDRKEDARQSSTPAQPPAPLTIDLTALPPSLMSLYRDASGEMGQITPTFRGWFDQVTTRYTREQCEQVFRQLSADIAAGKTNGSKWQHTVSLFKSLYETPTKANGIAAPGRSDYSPGTPEELAEARRVMDEHRARLKELEATG